MEIQNVSRVSELNGYSLNSEELAGLEVGILQRRLEENISSNLFFWGKIFGSKQDYLVLYALDTFAEFPIKNYYYWLVLTDILRIQRDVFT